jgi:methyltransferase-like protein/SAM-dependent methyltransferase
MRPNWAYGQTRSKRLAALPRFRQGARVLEDQGTRIGPVEDYFYEALPFAETHPDHLGAIGTLFGIHPTPPKRFRLLEIGTATGGNILPMAAAFPECDFVAIDRAEQSLAVAKNHAERARISNLVLHLADVRDFEDEPESFDYIVCHGVYSWIPNDARIALRRLIRRHLAPAGIAYLSFNTLPGWHLRGSLRDMLRREVRGIEAQSDRVAKARAFLEFMATNFESSDPARTWLSSELAILSEMSDHYLLGEHLVEHNQPEYLEDFVRDMDADKLAFVTDAHAPLVFPERLGSEAVRSLRERGRDFLTMQQSLDLVELRCFRRAVLCRDDASLDRRVVASRIQPLAVRSRLEPVNDAPDLSEGIKVSFKGLSTAITTDQAPLKAALVELAARAPRGMMFESLVSLVATRLGSSVLKDDVRARLSRNVLGLYTKGALDLWSTEKPIAYDVEDAPRAFSFARYQAEQGSEFCTTLLHEAVRVDTFDRALVKRLDGTHDLAALVDAALEDARAGIVSVEMNGSQCVDREVFLEIAEQKLLRLARMGFLVE